MNVFILDDDQKRAAQFHTDRHCVKMILETAQLLCSAHHMSNSKLDIPYRLSHKNHPCSIWTRTSLSNYLWLANLGIALSHEYTYRYGKTHKSSLVVKWALDNIPNIPDSELTPFAQAMPEKYKSNDAIQAYRNYYTGEKKHLFKWKKRNTPYWIMGNALEEK